MQRERESESDVFRMPSDVHFVIFCFYAFVLTTSREIARMLRVASPLCLISNFLLFEQATPEEHSTRKLCSMSRMSSSFFFSCLDGRD